ncbi:hypothetical protein BA062_35370 [Prauserella flavalba]|uniref:Enoyl-CoA hydratase n=2 Tax=Prauserella flavalba TaxID=1477506 RepID=A0A318LD19_9PSEU|nr:hypothetical protein BA062_35370 [Prauserella flavalba]
MSRRVLALLRADLATLPGETTAVVLSGDGDVFSAGADLRELTGTRADLAFDEELAATIEAVRAVPVPVVAAIEGPCLGAAVELALACDLRIAGAGAWFRVPAVDLGLLYRPETIARLHRTLPRDIVTRLVLLGQRLDADDGLASEVVASGQAVARAHAVAEKLPVPGPAFRQTKALLAELDDAVWDTGRWERVRLELLDSDERRQAISRRGAFR